MTCTTHSCETERPNAQTNCLRLVLRGVVQGVGFRPFVHRLAGTLALGGWVKNSTQGVVIEVEGPKAALEKFLVRLQSDKPPQSSIHSLESTCLEATGCSRFEIRESAPGGSKETLVLPDIATCPDCLLEIFDPANRRYRYPFTNCTHCGPRFSIIQALPYDRGNTSMRGFVMCDDCRAEYVDPGNRRFHAQPNACPVCGPQLELWRGRVREKAPDFVGTAGGFSNECGDAALLGAAEAIRAGQIVAVKGIGGFHLICLASDDAAIHRLRLRKHRDGKPLAVLFPSVASVHEACEVSLGEERLLRSVEAPIVLLRRRSERGNGHPVIGEAVAPNNPNLGAMLPSNPLHHLLMQELEVPVVATSGNLSEEPICIDELEAVRRLEGIADLFLVHNRPIVRHVDDSIVRVMLDRELMLRRARGYAPLPLMLKPRSSTPGSEPVLAVGAHLKDTVALKLNDQVFLSQHIGDLSTEAARTAFRCVIEDFEQFYEVTPGVIASDLHPDYLSSQYAASAAKSPAHAGQARRPVHVQVQHHVAHVLSCMAENDLCPPALGVSWDGSGLGTDGTVWGGEFFLMTEDGAQRIAHLRPFRLPGGEAAVREPRRSALGLLHELFGDDVLLRDDILPVASFTSSELDTLRALLNGRINSPLTSSMGRLFDGVASIVGLSQRHEFEGQAAMALEHAADQSETDEAYRLPICGSEPAMIDWRPMIEAILDDLRHQVSVSLIAAKFHNALAEAVSELAVVAAQPCVVLSGGCFQNKYLTERMVRRLRSEGFRPYWHQRVPPNDGGIALGQVVAAFQNHELH